jgi:hypothetical protein
MLNQNTSKAPCNRCAQRNWDALTPCGPKLAGHRRFHAINTSRSSGSSVRFGNHSLELQGVFSVPKNRQSLSLVHVLSALGL